MSVRIFVFRKVGLHTCHVAYEDVDATEALPNGSRVTGYLGGSPTGAEVIAEGDRRYAGCRVVALSRGDTLVEVWEDPRRTSPSAFRGTVIAGCRYTLHSSIAAVLKQGRMPS